MEVKILQETGYIQALQGLALSFYDHKVPFNEWWTDERRDKAAKRSIKQAWMQGGHNKFLESIICHIYIKAPRCFWSEYDTYRAGVTKQSSSTMHTLDKRLAEKEDFTDNVEPFMLDGFNQVIVNYWDIEHRMFKDISYLKDNLPEGWLQERVVMLSYKTLQNILMQRKGHRLKYWDWHRDALLQQLLSPSMVYKEETK